MHRYVSFFALVLIPVVCEALNHAVAVAKTKPEIDKAKLDRDKHNEFIGTLRQMLISSEIKASSHPESLCLIQVSRLFDKVLRQYQVDCVDQTSVHVPSTWEQHQYDTYKKSGFYDQKLLLAVIEKPPQYRYYAGPPHVKYFLTGLVPYLEN